MSTPTASNTAQQSPPAPGADLGAFPTVTAQENTVWRAHRADLGPWWFSNRGTGRFDLSGNRGSCYAADDVETAVREALGPLASNGKTITDTAAARLAVHALRLPEGRYANITAKRAVRHGVHRELSTMVGPSVPQSWAAAFDQAGYAGVRYASRFTSEPGPNAWAIFGPAGADQDRDVGTRVDGHVACASAGVPVAPPVGPKRSYRIITGEA